MNRIQMMLCVKSLWIGLLFVLAGCSGGNSGGTPPNASGDYISGHVYLENGSTLGGVSILVKRLGDSRPVATTGANGYYYLGGLSNATYTVTPALTGYTFSPPTLEVTPTASSVNFTAVHLMTPLYGLNFSPYMSGQSPSTTVISEAQIRARLLIIAPYTKWIRCYAMNHGLENIGRIAHELGLKTAVGAWLSSDVAANAVEVNALVSAAKSGYVDLAIVGSEVLLRRDLSENALIGYINQFRSQVPMVPVTTAEPNTELLWRSNVVNACDIMFVNYYPYWNGESEGRAIVQLNAAHQQIVDLYRNKPIMVSETGWPSAGESVQDAVSSSQNASRYLMDFVSWAESVKCDGYFYFEAFDETWKKQTEGERGGHWGIWDENGQMKSGMAPVFEGIRNSTNTSGTVRFAITSVPPHTSSSKYVEGMALGIVPNDFRVAVYILVRGGWWTKPYWDTPLTGINYDGRWVCNIITSGTDSEFTEVAAYLVPASYNPPLARGGNLPRTELMTQALSEARVVRP